MIYITSDIHNSSEKFNTLLEVLHFSESDKIYIAGDIFDRGNKPDPLGLYHRILKLGKQCAVIRGNHDQELAGFIMQYYNTPERRRKKLPAYKYNSFELLHERLTPRDMLDLAEWILDLPLQVEIQLNVESYLIAHARTSPPNEPQPQAFYLSSPLDEDFMANGVEEYISVVGHRVTPNYSIWNNERRNVIRIDCGCGYREGRLGCICLDTKEEIYV